MDRKGNAGRSISQFAEKYYAGRIVVTLTGVAAMFLPLFLKPDIIEQSALWKYCRELFVPAFMVEFLIRAVEPSWK